jgi:hypothetical protein
MNRTIFLSTAAAIAAALVQPVEAKDRKGEGRGGGGGGGGGKHQAAPKQAQRAQAPRVAARPQARSLRAPAARVQTPSRVGRSPALVKQRDARPQNRRPSIAFGGTSAQNVERRTNVQNINRFNNRNVRNDFRRDRDDDRDRDRDRDFRRDRRDRPSIEIYRHWDRRHVHSWNNNRYRWHNNSWVIIGGGYSPYYYGSTAYYNDYDYAPSVVAEFSPTSNLASEVQEELSRRGYSTGGVDGVIGPQTRSAIAAFQADNGLAATGRIDQSLLRELGI